MAHLKHWRFQSLNKQKKDVVLANLSFCAMTMEEDVFRAKRKKKGKNKKQITERGINLSRS